MTERAEDMPTVDYIESRNGVWYFRRKVPKVIREWVARQQQSNTLHILRPGQKLSRNESTLSQRKARVHVISSLYYDELSQQDIRITLDTKDKDEAKILKNRKMVFYDGLFAKIYAAISLEKTNLTAPSSDSGLLSHNPITLSDEDIQKHINNELHYLIEGDEALRINVLRPNLSKFQDFPQQSREHLQKLKMALSIGDIDFIDEAFIRNRVANWKYDYDLLDEQTIYAVKLAILKQEVKYFEVIAKRNEGEIIEANKIAPFTKDKPKTSLDALFNDWKASGIRPEKTNLDYLSALILFKTFVNDKTAESIVRRDVLDWRDHLTNQNTLNSKTIQKRVRQIATIFNVAVENERLTTNPALHIKIAKQKVDEIKRLPFDESDLLAIFNSPIFKGGKIPAGGKGTSAVWLPLIALYSGAREEEIGQLAVVDFKEKNGIHYFSITDLGEDQKLKNTNSRREVPIHTELIKAGLLAYIAELRDKGQIRAFPELIPDIHMKFTANWSKWWGRYLRKTIKITDTRKVFHSFRHTFKDACREAELSEDIHDLLSGHRGGGQGREYGQGHSLKKLSESMNRVHYPNLITPLLFPLKKES